MLPVQEKLQMLRFDNTQWETMSRQKRDALITDLTIKQMEFARREVPFYTKLYENLQSNDLNDMKDCAVHIPAVVKDQIRHLPSPYDLLPKSVRANMGVLWMHRGTGGTTGPPTSTFYTYGDYDANISGNLRISRLARGVADQLIAFSGYNQGHISGPYFDEVVRRLGACIITRNFGTDDETAVLQMKHHKCNCIIGPPVSTHKGGSFQDLLEADLKTGANYINGDNIKLLVFSSTGMTHELYEELTMAGIKQMVNIYGSTDVCTVSVSPPNDPFELMMTYGHNSSYVIGAGQEPVKSGERGMLISSRIGSYDERGNVIPNQGTQLLNFHLGDEVTYRQQCSVEEWSLPSMSGVKRAENSKEKIEGGCEAW